MSDGMSLVAQNAVGVTPARWLGRSSPGLMWICARSRLTAWTRDWGGHTWTDRLFAVGVREWAELVPGSGGARRDGGVHRWLFVARALEDVGAVAHLAEPVEKRALAAASVARRPTARTPCGAGAARRGPAAEAWIAPEHIRQWRSRLHLRKALIDERTQWPLRIRSVLYHHGISAGAPAGLQGLTAAASLSDWIYPRTRASGSRSRLA